MINTSSTPAQPIVDTDFHKNRLSYLRNLVQVGDNHCVFWVERVINKFQKLGAPALPVRLNCMCRNILFYLAGEDYLGGEVVAVAV